MRLLQLLCGVVLGVMVTGHVIGAVDEMTPPTGQDDALAVKIDKVKSDGGDVGVLAGEAINYIEYLYGVGNGGVFLIQVDHPEGEVSSSLLFTDNQAAYYGAATSGDANWFWAVSSAPGDYGYGSALYQVYPREQAVMKINENFGYDPRHPGSTDYFINMREIAYDEDADVLYGTDYLGLYTIDPVTGAASYIGDFGEGVDGEIIDNVWSMDYDAQLGQLLIVNQKLKDGVDRIGTHLYSVDTATAGVTYIGQPNSFGMTDILDSSNNDLLYGVVNFEHQLYTLDRYLGVATPKGGLGDNMTGLGGSFVEVQGPQVWITNNYCDTTVSVYSELNGDRDSDSATKYHDGVVSASAFVQEEVPASGVGQTTQLSVDQFEDTDLQNGYWSTDIEFDSIYDGGLDHGKGGGTVTFKRTCMLSIMADDVTYFQGDRVILLVDGEQFINNEISDYALDWTFRVYDGHMNRDVLVMTQDDVAGPDGETNPILGAMPAVVGMSYGHIYAYQVEFTLTLDIDMLAGDINLDGKVNFADVTVLAEQWLRSDCSDVNNWCFNSDVDKDGQVDISDVSVVGSDWVQGDQWDDDNTFELDFDFVFRAIEMPEASVLLNDECDNAIVMTPDTEYYGTTVGATGTDISGCGYQDTYDVWYKLIPTEDGVFNIMIESAGETINPVISVYDSCGGDELFCWEGAGYDQFFTAEAWTEYYIRIADSDNSTGDFKVVAGYYPPPVNDDCSGSIELEMDGYVVGDTYGATGTMTSSCGDGDLLDVWYHYTATDDNPVVFELYGNDYDQIFTVSAYDSCDEGTRTEISCSVPDNFDGDLDPVSLMVLDDPVPGETYYIRVARNEGSFGRFDMNVRPGPENDDCVDAFPIYLDSYEGGMTVGATGSDITSCGEGDTRSVWYEFYSDSDQMVMFEVYDYSGAGLPFTVAVFDSCGGSELACTVAESDGYEGEGSSQAKLIYTLSAGQTVYVRVAYEEGQMGYFDISAHWFEPPYNDSCDSADVIEWGGGYGWTTGASGDDVSGCFDGDNQDVWYVYTAEMTGMHVVILYGEEGGFSGTVTVYDGDSCDPLGSELGCAETEWDYLDMPVDLVSGQSYLIRVASDEAGQGNFGFEVFAEGIEE